MRLLTLTTLSVSAIALSGCSFINGVMGHGGNHAPVASTSGTYATADDCCVGEKALSRWNLEGEFGPEFVVGGDAFTGSQGHAGIPGQVLRDVEMKDAYDVGYRVGLGASYALNPNRKLTGNLSYSKAEGNETIIGTQGANNIVGLLGDYESIGVEAGLRQYFQPRIAGEKFNYRPYVEGRLGASNVSDISLAYRQPGVAGSQGVTPFYEGGWVPNGAALVGVETPLFKRGTLGLETGVRYQGALDSAPGLLAAAPQFGGANNGSERVTIPLTVRGRYRF